MKGPLLAVVAFCLTLVVACSGSDSTSSSSTVTSSSSVPTTTAPPPPTTTGPGEDQERSAAISAVHSPEGVDRAPLVVLVPGGGWHSADPLQLDGLGRHLANAGNVAATVAVRGYVDGVGYPLPLDDVACGIRQARERAEEESIEVGPVVLVGHSSGAHLSALVALGTEDLECDEEVDALVGLAGAYDVTRLPALAVLLFGVAPEEDPDLWDKGNPLLQASLRPELPVLLVHGDADPLLPVSFSEDFANRLQEAGHDVGLTVIPDADHVEIFSAEVVGDLIDEWIDEL